MAKILKIALVAFAVLLSASAFAAPRGGGGGGGRGGGGGGGGAHFGGGGGFRGGGAHFGGGGFRGGGAHFGGGGFRGGGAHFGGRQFGGGRHVARPAARGNRSVVRSNRANRAVGVRNGANRSVGRANRNVNRNVNRNAATRGARNANVRSSAVRQTLNSRSVAGQLHNRSALRDPRNRARIAASAARAGWQHGRNGHGWWRHRYGGYGWVGPLFWPFAYYDIYDYTLWGGSYGYYDDPFWDYGYNDIYAGLFSPYGYDALAGYLPDTGRGSGGSQPARAASAAPTSSSSTQSASDNQLGQMCGDAGQDIAGLPIDQIQKAIQPNEAQQAALDELGNASVKAAQDIKAACPTTVALTAPKRLAAMQARIEAMIAAVATVQPPLEKFYGLLSDEQKARLNALGADQQRKTSANKTSAKTTAAAKDTNSPTRSCGSAQAGVTEWPTAKIEAALHPTETQRASLTALQDANAKAADMLRASCEPNAVLTPTARLAAIGKRLNSMLDAVKTVSAALDNFYGTLSDEQKAQFEAIGPQKQAALSGSLSDQSSSDLASSDDAEPAPTQRRRHHARHNVNVPGIVRQFMGMMP